MSIYELLLFVHIMAAIVWVGGAVASQIISFRVLNAGDAGRKAALAGDLEWMGTRVFTPASGILLLFGIFLVLNAKWSWGSPGSGAASPSGSSPPSSASPSSAPSWGVSRS